MCHAKPKDKEQAALWKQLVDGNLPTPDTWEVALSTGKDKKETWQRLISEDNLGALALLRNLRNMAEAKVEEGYVFKALEDIKTDRVLPYRFIAAARAVPQWESHLEKAMLKSLESREKLSGKTIILVDVSGSMSAVLSEKSDLSRIDAANGLAILARELCQEVAIYTFSNNLARVPDRHGFALRDAILHSQPNSSTYLGGAISKLNEVEKYDRIIVLTDEQSSDEVPNPTNTGYMINVAAYKNGVGYGAWNHIDGFSEAVFDYVIESEKYEPD
jgi:hypothetical protein